MNKKVIIYGSIILAIGIGVGLYFVFKKPDLTEESFKEEIVVQQTSYNENEVPQLPDEDVSENEEDSGSEEDDDYNSEYE